MGFTDDDAVAEFEAALKLHRDPFTGQATDVALPQAIAADLAEGRNPSLLERLQASLAARQGAEAAPDDAEALAALQARQAAAWAHLRDFVAWVNQGSAVMAALWDAVPDADSVGLCDLLRLVTDRESGLTPTLGLLQRHVEATLGDRHGRTAIMADDDVVAGVVERAAASTKWDVESAWPAIAAGIRACDRLPIGDPADGELEDDTARALRIIRQLCGVSYLKVGACDDLGIDPEDYRTKSGYRWVVKLP